ncbi:hypothetical protein RA210_U170014 [Rubrivivax sp. A210]|nr:hypothetical protein RA210_U170014 [Rubrivivax sp. A210]
MLTAATESEGGWAERQAGLIAHSYGCRSTARVGDARGKGGWPRALDAGRRPALSPSARSDVGRPGASALHRSAAEPANFIPMLLVGARRAHLGREPLTHPKPEPRRSEQAWRAVSIYRHALAEPEAADAGDGPPAAISPSMQAGCMRKAFKAVSPGQTPDAGRPLNARPLPPPPGGRGHLTWGPVCLAGALLGAGRAGCRNRWGATDPGSTHRGGGRRSTVDDTAAHRGGAEVAVSEFKFSPSLRRH